jgi:hypothetical protein
MQTDRKTGKGGDRHQPEGAEEKTVVIGRNICGFLIILNEQIGSTLAQVMW